ncbi:unnamed protein product [Larinioides sclopetarius]|uniref:DUF1146 domain-containing protein n=1 Tax=Larinioides sclopetarius TaxID=280406 RepID=A0AAV1ZNZ3_9ARAC
MEETIPVSPTLFGLYFIAYMTCMGILFLLCQQNFPQGPLKTFILKAMVFIAAGGIFAFFLYALNYISFLVDKELRNG